MKSENFASSSLDVKEEEELDEEIHAELKIPDPPEKRIIYLTGTGKLIAEFKP